MPLLHKKSFVKKKLDSNLKSTDKVFFCDQTEEIFTDYDEFWERLVLLNALVWTCEITGKPNLTYQEAIDSERKARKCFSNVSLSLKRPMMYIASLTKRSKIIDMSDDIFNYIRDRYFVGEEVDAIVSKHWYDCKVTRVILPTPEDVEKYEKETAESDEDVDDDIQEIPPVSTNGNAPKDDDDDDDEIQVIRDDHHLNTSGSVLQPSQDPFKDIKVEKDAVAEYPPFATVKYEVIEIEPWDYKDCKRHIVTWDQIRRPKGVFSREKSKLLIKQCVKMNNDGYWVLKDSLTQKYNIKKMSYSDIFVGTPPKFEVSVVTKKPSIEKPKKEKKDKTELKKIKPKGEKKVKKSPKGKQNNKEIKKKEPKIEENPKPVEKIEKKQKPPMTEEEREAAKKAFMEIRERKQEQMRRRLELMRAEKKKERDLQKEEKRLMVICKSHWDRKREDLICDDHKDLPSGTPIQCRIPNNLFGDFAMVLEFLNAFTELLELNDVYPHGINFDMLEHSLVEKEVAGVFNDVVQLLLGAIFSLQEEEDEEIEGDTTVDMASMDVESNLKSKSLISAVKLANLAATWSQQYQGASLQKVPLDALTLTEVLRLHILASGATNNANAVWRHANRGGYKNTDDPGLQFKLDEPEIIKKLTSESIFDLTINEKMKILIVLVNQILTYASVRDSIDEKVEKLKESTNNLRIFRWAEHKREREETIARKQRERDEKKKQIVKKVAENLGEKKPEGEIKMEDKKPEGEIKMEDKKPEGEIKMETEVIVEEEEQPETEEEKAARLEREEKNRERKKQEMQKKEKDFLDKIQSLSRGVRHMQFGMDRAHRRYWMFNSLHGLFVEDLDPYVGSCLDEPTPVCQTNFNIEEDKEVKEKIHIQAIKNMKRKDREKETEKNSSDKENENSESPIKGAKPTNKKLLQTPNQNIVVDSSTPVIDLEDPEEDKEDLLSFLPIKPNSSDNLEELHSKIFGLCSSNALTCPVHSLNHNRPRWSFFHSTDSVEHLLSALNERGVRESELKESLLTHKEKIDFSLQNCPAYKLDPSQDPEMPTMTMQRKSERHNPALNSGSSNLNFPPGTPVEKILELTLRDMVLEVEEKLDTGMLASLKVTERDVWRTALVEGTSLSFSQLQDLDWGGRKRIKQMKEETGLEVPDHENFDSEDLVSKDGLTQAGVIKELAIALLQVAQSVEHKYVKVPLAESEKSSRRRLKAENRLKKQQQTTKGAKEGGGESSSEEEDESFDEKMKQAVVSDNALRTPFERWEKSLMACTSFSQIFLHLATLDSSISWSRSATNTRCSICRRKSDPENMLLCDECDRGYHMFCLKPKLKSVPSGDWFCDKCKPKLKPKSPRKQRKMYTEVESDEDEEEEEEMEDEEDEEEGFINHEYCDACEMGGEIICCDTCPRSFHPDCADLRKIPRGDWSCPLCKEEQAAPKSKSKKAPVKKSKKKKKKKSSRRTSDEDENRRGVKRTLEEAEDEEFHHGAIESILEELVEHEDSWPFTKPVTRTDAPDYYDKIKQPIDLKTIRSRFNRNKYSTDAEFVADVLRIFSNCQQYYRENDDEYKASTKLCKFFQRKLKSHKLSNAQEPEEGRRPAKRKK